MQWHRHCSFKALSVHHSETRGKKRCNYTFIFRYINRAEHRKRAKIPTRRIQRILQHIWQTELADFNSSSCNGIIASYGVSSCLFCQQHNLAATSIIPNLNNSKCTSLQAFITIKLHTLVYRLRLSNGVIHDKMGFDLILRWNLHKWALVGIFGRQKIK
jgi:hypothetical protein